MTPEQLRASILQQAMEGKLVKQDPNDEPASELLEKIKAEKEQLVKEKKIKKTKVLSKINDGEKPFDIPNSWEWVRIGDISDKPRYGYTASAKEIGNVKFLRITDIQGNKVNWDNVPFCTITQDKLNSLLLKVNDVLIARTGGTVGKSFIIRDQVDSAVFASYLIRLRLLDDRIVPFISEFLKSPLYWTSITNNVSGTGQPNINATKLTNIICPLPPLKEQQRIVTRIEKLMPLVDEYEKAYNRLKSIDNGFNDKMKQSILQYAMEGKLVKQDSNDEPASELLKKIKDEKKQLVKEKKIKRSKSLPRISEDEKLFDIPESWEWVRLKDITNFGNFNSVAGQDIQEGSWVLNMEDIIKNGGGFNKFTIKKLNDDFKSNKYIVEVGDVLYGKLRPYLRKIEIAPKNGFTTTEMFPIKVINQNLISPYYLRYVMLSPYFANRINGSTYGMKMPRVGTKYLASMLIPLPPFEEQKRIVTKVEKMMALVK